MTLRVVTSDGLRCEVNGDEIEYTVQCLSDGPDEMTNIVLKSGTILQVQHTFETVSQWIDLLYGRVVYKEVTVDDDEDVAEKVNEAVDLHTEESREAAAKMRRMRVPPKPEDGPADEGEHNGDGW